MNNLSFIIGGAKCHQNLGFTGHQRSQSQNWPTICLQLCLGTLFEPSHEIMVLFVLRKLILQMCMGSHPVGQDVWFLVGSFVYFHTLCVWTAKALARLCECAGLPEPSLLAYVISNIILWAGSFYELLLATPTHWASHRINRTTVTFRRSLLFYFLSFFFLNQCGMNSNKKKINLWCHSIHPFNEVFGMIQYVNKIYIFYWFPLLHLFIFNWTN